MKKRVFEILDEMNVSDTEKGTKLIGVSNYFVSGEKVKQGSLITMGAEESALMDIMQGNVIPLLLLIDKSEYENRKTK